MAHTNYTRALRYNQKRSPSQLVATVLEGAVASPIKGIVAVTSGNELIAKLPANCLVTNAYVFVQTASNAATSAAFTLGTAEAGSQLASAINAKTLGKQGTFTGPFLTGTGINVFLGRTITGAATPVGKFHVVVEYIELDKVTGEYTELQ